MRKAISISDFHRDARRRLPKILFDWIEGGAGDERSLGENESVFDRYRFLPRYLLDISERSQRKALFGRVYNSPIGIAPTGYAGLFRKNADLMLAETARAANIPYIMSGSSVNSMEEAAAISRGTLWYQLYSAADAAITTDLIARADAAGCEALVVTIDIPLAGKRERDMRNGFSLPLKMSPSLIVDGLLHPAWTIDYLMRGGLPAMANWAPYAPAGSSAIEIAKFANSHSYCVQTWEHLEAFRRQWPHKLVVKGVMHPDDARRALEIGVDGFIVSNHGGRQYDRAVAAPVMLPTLREALGPDVPLMMDGGIRRGSDVFAALCLGADFVFCGRAMLYGVVSQGATGAARAHEILRDELDNLMGQIGCLSLEDSDLPQYLHGGVGRAA